MMKLTALDSGQSQSRAEASICTDNLNIKNHNETNCDLFKDFFDTYFRFPIYQQKDLSNHTSTVDSLELSVTDDIDSCNKDYTSIDQ